MVVQAAVTFYAGSQTRIAAGRLFADDDPVVMKYPDHFRMVDEDGTTVPIVEAATAEPGERSTVRRPARSKGG